jgi:hypothetical protein
MYRQSFDTALFFAFLFLQEFAQRIVRPGELEREAFV